MSEFDDTIHTDRDPQPEPSVGTANQKKLESKSLIEMLTGDGDINQLGKQLNLDSDMTEKVLLPLINFLDKYGVGESLSTNQTVNKGVGLFGFVSDVAPILRSATEYFQGKKTELSNEDEAFLERIKEAQNFDSMSLFVGEEVEDDDSEPEIQEPVGPPPSNPFTDGPVDWNEMLGVTSPSHNVNQSQYSSIAQAKKQTFGGITGIEALAAEQGLSIAQITNDRQSATNSGGVSSSNVDYTNNDSLNSLVMSGMDEIQRAMKGEQNRQAAQSKVIFEGEKLATPDAITQYSPNIDHVPAAPTMKGLETMEDMMARQGITTFEERKPSSEEVEMFDEGEMEFIESTNSFRNKYTGDEYEAVLTQVPESYFDQPIQTFQSAIETPAPIQDIVEMMQEEIIEESIITPTYYNMLVTELKSELKAAGLSQVGTKKELIQRLNNSEE
jgi:hypothetical protein